MAAYNLRKTISKKQIRNNRDLPLDTDVLVLADANHHLLLRNTSVSMLSGVINVEPIARALGRQRANALPALRAFSGADTVGQFNQLDKAP